MSPTVKTQMLAERIHKFLKTDGFYSVSKPSEVKGTNRLSILFANKGASKNPKARQVGIRTIAKIFDIIEKVEGFGFLSPTHSGFKVEVIDE
tara:strand:- start:93 stop:368 length:276 start_codon:yes stop_codon:yes gene_type:complete